jgi:hypothetical protein
MRIDFGGSKEQKPQLPCLIPLFDHHHRPSFVPSSSSSSSLFTHQALLQEYQQKIIGLGGPGHSASSVGEAGGPIQDPKTAQLLEIQNCLVDCCARLARFMAPDSAPIPPANPTGSLDGRPGSSSQLDEISKDDGNVSGSQGADDEVQVDQVGKGKGKSDGE